MLQRWPTGPRPTAPTTALLTTALEKRVGSTLGLAWDPSGIERVLQAGRASLFYAGYQLLMKAAR